MNENKLSTMLNKIKLTINAFALECDKKFIHRKRLLSTTDILRYVMMLSCSPNETGKRVLDQCNSKRVSMTAIDKFRNKIEGVDLKSLFRAIVSTLPTNGNSIYNAFSQRQVFAIDGSQITLDASLKGIYVTQSKTHYPSMYVSCLHNCTTNLVHDFETINVYDERKLAINHLKYIPKDAILVLDRGYHGQKLISACIELKINFVVRLKCTAYKPYMKYTKGDNSKQSYDENMKVAYDGVDRDVRFVQYELNGHTYSIITNLTCNTQIPKETICSLYHQRWSVEEFYKTFKPTTTTTKDTHSKKEQFVLQELYARLIMIHISKIIELDIVVSQRPQNKEFEPVNKFCFHKPKKNKVGVLYKMNMKRCMDKLKEVVLEKLLDVNTVDINIIIKSLTSELTKSAIEVRPKRSFPRLNKGAANKYKHKESKAKAIVKLKNAQKERRTNKTVKQPAVGKIKQSENG